MGKNKEQMLRNPYDAILNDFPDEMKKEIIKAGDCKKLVGGTCSRKPQFFQCHNGEGILVADSAKV